MTNIDQGESMPVILGLKVCGFSPICSSYPRSKYPFLFIYFLFSLCKGGYGIVFRIYAAKAPALKAMSGSAVYTGRKIADFFSYRGE